MDTSGSLAPLRHRPFRWLVAGRTASMLGGAVASIALAFAVLDLTGSVRDLGLVIGARSLASVVFLLAGGVIADRFPRRPVMVVASTLAAATQALAAGALLRRAREPPGGTGRAGGGRPRRPRVRHRGHPAGRRRRHRGRRGGHGHQPRRTPTRAPPAPS